MADRFIPTGSTGLDCILGGGWALGRIGHIVGDSSTNKTGLCIEASALMSRTYPGGLIYYCDGEAAFDPEYAARLGMPQNGVTFTQPTNPANGLTIEDYERHINKLVADIDKLAKDKNNPLNVPGLFILDSLDSLPTEKEATTKVDDRGGYGAEKAKYLAELFRVNMQKIAERDIANIVISQTRANLNPGQYGPKKTYSGGNAMQFYASQQLWLTKIGSLKKEINGEEHIYGVQMKAKCTKNKCAPPFREWKYTLIFGYGIDDLSDNLEWLHSQGKLGLVPEDYSMTGSGKNKHVYSSWKNVRDNILAEPEKKTRREVAKIVKNLTITEWNNIQDQLSSIMPDSKYDDDDQ